ncbi:Ff.00g038380.m01.CDS01 [Fusarium sp. VM40]|nr:Ff.00g038380.m01.CDS01 [Fusarium sp. VM40]
MPLLGAIEPLSIYITLDTRAKKGDYHWGLILTDAATIPVLHDASNRDGPWIYREKRGDPTHSLTLIALIRVGDVSNHAHATHLIQSSPVNGRPSPRTGETFTCRTWVNDTLVALHENGVTTLPADIDTIEKQAVDIGLKYASISEAGEGVTVVNGQF